MRILLPISLILLIASAIWAPQRHAARQAEIDTSGLIVADPRQRAATGEKDRALGLAMTAYREILEKDPSDAEALLGLFRASLRLGGVVPRQPGIMELLQSIAVQYSEQRDHIDPDGTVLQEAVGDWIQLRLTHEWYLARASLAIWLVSRGDQRGYDEILDLIRQGPFWRDYFSYCQRVLPNWVGVERLVRHFLEDATDNVEARLYASVTLLYYNRLYGVGGELLKKHRGAIRTMFIEWKTAMMPELHDNSSLTPGGQLMLGLALIQDKDARRILARMRVLDHPYLATALGSARLWAGIDSLDKVDTKGRAFEQLFPLERETFFRGVLLLYADHVRQERATVDPTKKARLVAKRKKPGGLEQLVEMARFSPETPVRVLATRVLAQIFPERAKEFHDKLIQAGGVDSLYGSMMLPFDERVPLLLPAVSSSQIDVAALAITGLLRTDGPVPIQMPTE
ncbi:MAG: hypothetical protein ACYTGZ_08770 [Planctomycetota bacterium]|jgi:hypothetical protein